MFLTIFPSLCDLITMRWNLDFCLYSLWVSHSLGAIGHAPIVLHRVASEGTIPTMAEA